MNTKNTGSAKIIIILIALAVVGVGVYVMWKKKIFVPAQNESHGTKSETGGQVLGSVGKEILFLSWGSGEKEIGLREEGKGGENWRYGPVGIDIDAKGNIYVGDSVNNRIVVYSKEGKYIRDYTVADGKNTSLNSLQVDNQGNVYVRVSRTDDRRVVKGDNLAVYNLDGNLSASYDISSLTLQKPYPEKLTIQENKVYLRTTFWRDVYLLGEASGKTLIVSANLAKGMPLDPEERLYYGSLGNDASYQIRVLDRAGKEKRTWMEVTPADFIGDDFGNVYFIEDKNGPKFPVVPIKVRKYNHKSDAVAQIEASGDYWTFLEDNRIEVDGNGNIYQLLTKQDGVHVIKWELK